MTTHTARILGGNYYANARRVRENGQRYADEVARQARTLDEARRALEDTGDPGYVQRWDERTQQRYTVCELDEAGNWWRRDPFRNNLLAMDPPPRKRAEATA